MRLVARVLAVAILPSIAAAQTESRSASPATPQATSSLGLPGAPVAAAPQSDSTPRALSPARVLVLDCPSASSTPALPATIDRERADSLGTAGLVALLCTRAKALPASAIPGSFAIRSDSARRADPHAEDETPRSAGAEHVPGSDE